MLPRDTLSVDATPIDTAGEHACSQYAFIGITTLGVAATARIAVSDRLAATLAIGDGVWWAPAYDRSQRRRVDHCACLL